MNSKTLDEIRARYNRVKGLHHMVDANGSSMAYRKANIYDNDMPLLFDYISELEARLGEYKSLEEQGLLVRLPCKIGDSVYRYDTEYAVFRIGYTKDLGGEDNEIRFWAEPLNDDDADLFYFWENDIGKTVFLTREEAERALNERGE